jgi:hypothetical protein
MRSTKYIFALLITAALGYGALIGQTFLGAYVGGHLPRSLYFSSFGLLLLPGIVSALVTGFLLAALARLFTPRFAIVIPMLATIPWVALHVWAVIVYGTRDIWWVVLGDIASLLIATYLFAMFFRGHSFGEPPSNSSKRTRVLRTV